MTQEDASLTLFESLLRRRGIRPARLEAKLREKLRHRSPDRKQLARWRLGKNEPRRKEMVRLLWAVREVTGDHNIQIYDLFDFDVHNPDNWTG